MAIINAEVVNDFSDAIKFNVSRLLLDYSNFIERQRSDVLDYYSGLTPRANESSFRKLAELIRDYRDLNDVIENNKKRISNTIYWELLETISDITTNLETIDNSSRWLRSAIAKNDFTPGAEIEHTLKMFQTLENVSRVIQGASSPENEWTTIALRNDLTEEGYTTSGGVKLQLGLKNRATIQIRTVVDTINGTAVYGKDFKRKLTIDADSEDIEVLSPEDTVRQSVEVLASLKQGDTPEFQGEGIQAGLVTGSNRASISYPILFRQIFNTFQRDDTLKSLRVTNIDNRDDSIFIEIQVETRIGEILTIETTI